MVVIEKIKLIEKKKISPPIKLISPRFNLERFFFDEPIDDKLNELIKIIEEKLLGLKSSAQNFNLICNLYVNKF